MTRATLLCLVVGVALFCAGLALALTLTPDETQVHCTESPTVPGTPTSGIGSAIRCEAP